MVSPQARREAATALMVERHFGVTHACGPVGISRSLFRYRSCRAGAAELLARIEAIAALRSAGMGIGGSMCSCVVRGGPWTVSGRIGCIA